MSICLDNDSDSPTTASSFTTFRCITIEELKTVLQMINKKTCSLDPAPTKIIFDHMETLKCVFLQMVNTTIKYSEFPDPLKQAEVTPILKQSKLDPEELKSFRPVSSIPFASKLIERVMYTQLDEHLEENNLYAFYQSAYRKHYSCESALTKLTDDLQKINNSGDDSVLVLLDCSSAFDTVDHQILLQKLEDDYMIKDNALKLIRSYLQNRIFATKVNNVKSGTKELKYGVPQGSLLGPLFYNLYTKDIETIVQKHGLKIITYADDCQLYVSFKSENFKETEEIIKNCLQDLQIWMDAMFLKLNKEKTVIKFFRTRRSQPLDPDLKFLNLDPIDSIKSLGVYINGKTKFDDFICNKVKICNLHLRNLYNIRHCLDHSTRVILVTNLILSKIDYCNILLLGATDKSLNPLKLIINKAIRFIFNLKYNEHISEYYKKLHFLPIRQRIKFKACLTAFKIFHGISPGYLQEDFHQHSQQFPMQLRPGTGRDSLMFALNPDDKNNMRLTTKIQREWNTLSLDTRNCITLTQFKTRLKTELFDEY